MSTETFVHLHLHTEFSLSDGLVRIKPLLSKTADLGMPAVAVTDRCNLFAMVKFYRAALSAGVQPIIGMELAVRGGGNEERTTTLVLLAQDTAGLRNLSLLSTRAYREGWHLGRATVREDWLDEVSDGLIALSGAREGEIGQLLLEGRIEEARSRLAVWEARFPGNFYIELQRTGRKHEEDYIQASLGLAAEHGIAVVATNDVRFLAREDFDAHEARCCIQQGYVLDDPNRPRHYSEEQYLRDPAEMQQLFSDIPEAVRNTVAIARRCNLTLELGTYSLPEFPIPTTATAEEHLCELSERGLAERLERVRASQPDTCDESLVAQYRERLKLELEVVNQMGFASYFLIVADFIQWAKNNSIPVGPGRGSGAGSLVAYALKITDVDPLSYDLLFERFLNPERISMPDFDIDFCMEGRDRVIDYVATKYGRDKVAQIATHGSMAAKAVVRDVGRVLGYPYGFVDRIAKLIPFEVGMTLDKALEQEEELEASYRSDEEVKSVIDLGRALEGLARNVGKHAGGVVIAPGALTDFTPLYSEEGSGAWVSQLDKDDVEAVGLVKFDFLGLRTLTIIDWAVETLNERLSETGEQPIDIDAIPMDDPRTFALLQAQRTTGVFQLESRGMKDLIKRLQPDCFEDIVALVALFRPGPLQSGMVDDFVDRKHGRAAVEYPHPALEPILKNTYGVILYQEQVMQIARVLAGYTLGSADLLRKAMGKKKPEEMAKQREVFTEGAVARGVAEDVATYIFDLMEKFAGYGFNKSHSTAYALVSYQTAWLKAHHPAAFMAAVLSSDMDNTEKVVAFIDECRALNLKITPPSVNLSGYRFGADGEGRVVYGLGAVKGVGESAIDSIVEERLGTGKYETLYDFCRRVDLRKLNRRALEALIRGGALDCLGGSRAGAMEHLPAALRLAEQRSENLSAGQVDMFGLESPSSNDVPDWSQGSVEEWDELRRLAEEKAVLGLYLSGHPIHRYRRELASYASGPLIQVLAQGGAQSHQGGGRNASQSVTVAGLVQGVRTKISSRGGRMAFLAIEDHTSRIEVRLFSQAYEQYKDIIEEDAVLVIEGRLIHDDFSDSLRLNAERLMSIETAREMYARRLLVKLEAGDFGDGLAVRLEDLLGRHRAGSCPVVIDYSGLDASAQLALDAAWNVKPSEELVESLCGLIGSDRVSVEYGH